MNIDVRPTSGVTHLRGQDPTEVKAQREAVGQRPDSAPYWFQPGIKVAPRNHIF